MEEEHVPCKKGDCYRRWPWWAGLSSAITLKQNGFDVVLYEKNDHLGGKLNRREQYGFGFDLGPSLLTMPYIFERLFERSGKKMSEYVEIEELELQWKSFFPDGQIINLYNDLNRMKTENPALTIKDMKEYKRFLKYAGGIDRLPCRDISKKVWMT